MRKKLFLCGLATILCLVAYNFVKPVSTESMAKKVLKELYTIDDSKTEEERFQAEREYADSLWANTNESSISFDYLIIPDFFEYSNERAIDMAGISYYRYRAIAVNKQFEMEVKNIELLEDFYSEADGSILHEFTRVGYNFIVTYEIDFIGDGENLTIIEKGKIVFQLKDNDWNLDYLRTERTNEIFHSFD